MWRVSFGSQGSHGELLQFDFGAAEDCQGLGLHRGMDLRCRIQIGLGGWQVFEKTKQSAVEAGGVSLL